MKVQGDIFHPIGDRKAVSLVMLDLLRCIRHGRSRSTYSTIDDRRFKHPALSITVIPHYYAGLTVFEIFLGNLASSNQPGFESRYLV